jgi:hypothetical protein
VRGEAEPPARAETLSVRAVLDVPGETGRQARVLGVWAVCLTLAVVLASAARPRVPERARGTGAETAEVGRSRSLRLKIAVLVGLGVPALLSALIARRRRRGGPHARGIVVDVTADGQLRLWGRGYGERVLIAGAKVTESLVDAYAGRLGAWRQRRLRIEGRRPTTGGGSARLEVATVATEADMDAGLPVAGGEGDCIELARADYFALLARVRELAGRTP